MTDNPLDDEHGPHGADCSCHHDTDDIRTELIEHIEDADLFAGIAINFNDGEPTATGGRAHDEDADIAFHEMLALHQMLDDQLHSMISGLSESDPSVPSPEAMLGGASGANVMAIDAEEAEQMGLLELLKEMSGGSFEPRHFDNTDSVEDAMNDFDGTDIDIE